VREERRQVPDGGRADAADRGRYCAGVSAGTKPGAAVNTLSAEALSEVGVDIPDQTPKPIDPQLIRDVDIVVTLGREARVEHIPGTPFENWDTDEPSERGIDGIERMRLVREDIAARVGDLNTRMRDRPALTDG
jgi:arsenate-mycothiol transferase